MKFKKLIGVKPAKVDIVYRGEHDEYCSIEINGHRIPNIISHKVTIGDGVPCLEMKLFIDEFDCRRVADDIKFAICY